MTALFQNAPASCSQSIRLFCVPHAGGAPSAFRGWAEQLAPGIEVVAVQLPGREARFREMSYTDLKVLVSDLCQAVLPWISSGERFAFFGKSLGGLVAFETAREIERASGKTPAHLFVAAAGAPHLPAVLPKMGHLPSRELVAKVSEFYGGIPLAVLEDEEFLEAVTVPLVADIRMLEAYERVAPKPLSCPITCFAGVYDRSTPIANIDAWEAQTTGQFQSILLEEGHLFHQSARDRLTATIRKTLLASN